MIRREVLQPLSLQADTHAGLWLDRYLSDFESGKAQAHLDETARLQIPPEYQRFFDRYRAALAALPDTQLARATVRGRMVVGLGAESVIETAITLHRTYGVPYIPGSALKGLVAAATHRHLEDPRWQKAVNGKPIGESHRILFGDLESGGHVVFHDALWIPEGASLPLDPDVMTVHHGRYYLGHSEAPTDCDNPVPVAFLSAHGSYEVALSGPAEWVDVAFEILKAALDQDGVGAKTAAGYGRMDLSPPPKPVAIDWQAQIPRIAINTAQQDVPRLLGQLQGEERRLAAQALARQFKTYLKKPESRQRPWVQGLLEAMQ